MLPEYKKLGHTNPLVTNTGNRVEYCNNTCAKLCYVKLGEWQMMLGNLAGLKFISPGVPITGVHIGAVEKRSEVV